MAPPDVAGRAALRGRGRRPAADAPTGPLHAPTPAALCGRRRGFRWNPPLSGSAPPLQWKRSSIESLKSSLQRSPGGGREGATQWERGVVRASACCASRAPPACNHAARPPARPPPARHGARCCTPPAAVPPLERPHKPRGPAALPPLVAVRRRCRAPVLRVVHVDGDDHGPLHPQRALQRGQELGAVGDLEACGEGGSGRKAGVGGIPVAVGEPRRTRECWAAHQLQAASGPQAGQRAGGPGWVGVPAGACQAAASAAAAARS